MAAVAQHGSPFCIKMQKVGGVERIGDRLYSCKIDRATAIIEALVAREPSPHLHALGPRPKERAAHLRSGQL